MRAADRFRAIDRAIRAVNTAPRSGDALVSERPRVRPRGARASDELARAGALSSQPPRRRLADDVLAPSRAVERLSVVGGLTPRPGESPEAELTARATDAARPPRADLVRVIKGARRLQLLHEGRVIASFRVALGRNPIGHKVRQGDGRTPEGRYTLDWRNEKSSYYRSIHISYPAAADIERGRRLGADPGGAIMIHGLPNGHGYIGSSHARRDWTEGCIAVTNEEMDQIWALVRDGTPIEILP